MINIRNTDDNECFKWCLLRYLNPADHSRRITKTDKNAGNKIDFKDIKFSVKIRDINKTVKKIPSALAFLVMKRRENIQSLYLRKTC